MYLNRFKLIAIFAVAAIWISVTGSWILIDRSDRYQFSYLNFGLIKVITEQKPRFYDTKSLRDLTLSPQQQSGIDNNDFVLESTPFKRTDVAPSPPLSSFSINQSSKKILDFEWKTMAFDKDIPELNLSGLNRTSMSAVAWKIEKLFDQFRSLDRSAEKADAIYLPDQVCS